MHHTRSGQKHKHGHVPKHRTQDLSCWPHLTRSKQVAQVVQGHSLLSGQHMTSRSVIQKEVTSGAAAVGENSENTKSRS